MVMHKTSFNDSVRLTPHPPTAAVATSAAQANPAPLSWKDAVQRGASHAKKTVARHASDTVDTSDLSMTAKLARSRSVSRIVQNAQYRKHGLFATSHASADLQAPHTPLGLSATSHGKLPGKQVSFSDCSTIAEASTPHDPVRRPQDESKRFADLVNRLGLNDTKRMIGCKHEKRSLCLTSTGTRCDGRPRSASADSVLLGREDSALWVLTNPAEIATMTTKSAASTTTTPCRTRSLIRKKDRAMSVPNVVASPVSTDSDSDASESPRDARVARLMAQAKLTGVVASEEDSSELDCDDTHSESTSDSSCPSPRQHTAVAQFDDAQQQSVAKPSSASTQSNTDEMDFFSDFMTPEDEEEDFEAYQLLDRINSLSAEFKAHREYEESSTIAWSVQHAARQGVIAPQLQQNLLANIRDGAWEEARDVLYHKCHLVPAVGSVLETPNQPKVDALAAEAFEKCVDELSPTDSSTSRHQKLRVLKILSDLLTKWVKIVGYERGLSEEHVALTSGSLFLAGSYRLGLNDPVSDIDAVCVVPWHVAHEDFFSSFCSLLEQTSGVTQLAPVPNAYVPLISLSFLGVSVDLLFARLPTTCVEPHQEIDSDHLLVGVDSTSMKSLNAPRVSSMLLCLVPKRRVFRIVLRAVRAWARRRGVYSAKLGYLGGISWAILVAFVCQMYPDAEPAKVFVRFFQVFSEWQWPRPVMLNMVYDAGLGFEMWDPRQNLYDRSHIMPVITPAYPHMNSAVQVSQSTFSVIYEELWRARYLAELASGITRNVPVSAATCEAGAQDQMNYEARMTSTPGTSSGTATTTTSDWDQLFQRSNFFIRYDSYFVVNFHADTASAMHVWGKFVQSRLRKLVDSLQHVSSVARVHAFPCYFPNTSDGRTPGSCMFIGVEFQTRSRSNTEAHGLAKDDPEVKSNLERTIRFFLATDLQQLTDRKHDMCAEAKLLEWAELPPFVFEHGQVAALIERAEYHKDMERMTMLQSHGAQFRNVHGGSYAGGNERFANGKLRTPNPNGGHRNGGNGRYFGGKGAKASRHDRYRGDSGHKSFVTHAAG